MMFETIKVPQAGLVLSSPLPENFTGSISDVNGNTAYFKDGEWHREDGPARIYIEGPYKGLEYAWHLNGDEYQFDKWCSQLNKTPEEILLLRITYGI